MSIEGQLLPATFRGIPFSVRSHTQVGGRKTATHEYPNQTARFVEDLGGLLGRFSVQAVVNEPAYFARRQVLKLTLDLPNSGILSHPWYGIRRVAVISYTISESYERNGQAIFNIEFEETTANVFPIFGGENVAIVSDLINTAILSVGDEIAKNMKLSSKNFTDTAGKQTELVNVLSEPLPSPAQVNQENFNQFSNDLDNFNDDRFVASQDSQKLSDNITDLLDSYNSVSDEAEFNYKLMKDLYDRYGIDDNDIISEAFYLQERRDNRNLLNSSIKGIALIYMFLAAVKIAYQDSDDLKLIQNELIKRYEEESANNVLTESVWNHLENIKFKTFRFFSQLKINQVITTKITRHTLTTFLYDYYENFDNEDEIIKLNNLFNPTKLQGDIKMVTINV